MKMVKSLLLGSAAGLFAVAGAQAADLPVKAKPVEYVKVCSLYGAGFYYIPGSDTCLKVGGYVHYHARWNAPNSVGAVYGAGPVYTLNDRRDTATNFAMRGRGMLSLDARSPTPWGVLRSYILVGASVDTDGAGGAGATPQLLRAFVQWNGFTVGRATSAFAGVSFSSPATGLIVGMAAGNTGGVPGLNVFNYTFQLGGGFSATIGMDDPLAVGNRVANANVTGALAVGAAAGLSPATYRMPYFAANVNYTSPTMQAQIQAAVKDTSGSYFNCGETVSAAAATQTVGCGHPADAIGYAVGAGILFTGLAAIGRPLDWFGVSGNYSMGAGVYSGAQPQTNPWRINPGSIAAPGSMGSAIDVDGVYGTLAGVQTGVQLTEKFAVEGGYDIGWTPSLRTSIYADYLSVRYNATAKALICQGNSVSATSIYGSGNQFSVCNPDFAMWGVGSRFLQWKPIPDFEISFDAKYTQLISANKGLTAAGAAATFTNTAAIGARNAGTSLVQDQGMWSAVMNVRRNFFN